MKDYFCQQERKSFHVIPTSLWFRFQCVLRRSAQGRFLFMFFVSGRFFIQPPNLITFFSWATM